MFYCYLRCFRPSRVLNIHLFPFSIVLKIKTFYSFSIVRMSQSRCFDPHSQNGAINQASADHRARTYAELMKTNPELFQQCMEDVNINHIIPYAEYVAKEKEKKLIHQAARSCFCCFTPITNLPNSCSLYNRCEHPCDKCGQLICSKCTILTPSNSRQGSLFDNRHCPNCHRWHIENVAQRNRFRDHFKLSEKGLKEIWGHHISD